jgi:hypothetical protein
MGEQTAARPRCSWPAIIFVPLVILMLLPTFVPRGNFAEIRFMRTFVAVFVARWAIAIIRKERNRDWLFYLFLLIAVPCAIYGLSDLFSH